MSIARDTTTTYMFNEMCVKSTSSSSTSSSSTRTSTSSVSREDSDVRCRSIQMSAYCTELCQHGGVGQCALDHLQWLIVQIARLVACWWLAAAQAAFVLLSMLDTSQVACSSCERSCASRGGRVTGGDTYTTFRCTVTRVPSAACVRVRSPDNGTRWTVADGTLPERLGFSGAGDLLLYKTAFSADPSPPLFI